MRFARRPWGFWVVLLSRRNFKVKLLRFRKGGSISLQKHSHRHELWLFLSGGGSMAFNIPPVAGDYRMIRRFSKHKYTAHKTTWVLEIQFGSYCIESDIERFDV